MPRNARFNQIVNRNPSQTYDLLKDAYRENIYLMYDELIKFMFGDRKLSPEMNFRNAMMDSSVLSNIKQSIDSAYDHEIDISYHYIYKEIINISKQNIRRIIENELEINQIDEQRFIEKHDSLVNIFNESGEFDILVFENRYYLYVFPYEDEIENAKKEFLQKIFSKIFCEVVKEKFNIDMSKKLLHDK